MNRKLICRLLIEADTINGIMDLLAAALTSLREGELKGSFVSPSGQFGYVVELAAQAPAERQEQVRRLRDEGHSIGELMWMGYSPEEVIISLGVERLTRELRIP